MRAAEDAGYSGAEGESFGRRYERLLNELLDTLSDEELCGSDSGRRIFLRLNSEGLPEAALIFDPTTGRTVQKCGFRLVVGAA